MRLLVVFFIFYVFSNSVYAQNKTSFKKEICEFRAHYKEKFLEEAQSPLGKKDLKHLKFFKPDEKYSIKSTVTLTPDSEPFEMATYSGQTQVYRKYAVLDFEMEGKKYQISVYQSLTLIRIPGYKDYLFLPFKDLTSGEETYGGGRYLDFKIGNIENGVLNLDFNKCYNPWCHYKDGYSCPIPPKENHLEVKILAGEKNFAKKE